MDLPPTPSTPTAPRRRGPWRLLAGTAVGFASCTFGLLLAAVGVVAVQEWMKPPTPGLDGLKPAVGEPAPDFVLKDLDGADYRLSDRLGKKPIVIEFGSATCPYCVQAADGMDELAKQYKDKIEFLFVYCREAHPDSIMNLPGSDRALPVLPQTAAGDDRSRRASSYARRSRPWRASWWTATGRGARRTFTAVRPTGSSSSTGAAAWRTNRALPRLPPSPPISAITISVPSGPSLNAAGGPSGTLVAPRPFVSDQPALRSRIADRDRTPLFS